MAKITNEVREKYLQKILAEQLESQGIICQLEVKTPVGNIDILTEDCVIELKEVNNFKEGIGQLLAYNTYTNKPRKALYLFGYSNTLNKHDVAHICATNDIETYYIKIQIDIENLDNNNNAQF